eukprot:391433-Pyramimonas_sp.AAC.1
MLWAQQVVGDCQALAEIGEGVADGCPPTHSDVSTFQIGARDWGHGPQYFSPRCTDMGRYPARAPPGGDLFAPFGATGGRVLRGRCAGRGLSAAALAARPG